MNALPLAVEERCWQRIGMWGDLSCPELLQYTSCNNCPVFSSAGRRFLDAPPPDDYAAEWAQRVAATEDEAAAGSQGALVFRLGDEWLALAVSVLVEVTEPRSTHRVPHRGGLLAGLVNVRGELHLCVRLDLLLGIDAPTEARVDHPRLISIRKDAEGWIFPADEVDQVHRMPAGDLRSVPPTLSRSSARLTRGVFTTSGRAIGLLDDERLFQTLRERVR
jgi:chemotaxis-related protein WspD